MKNLPFCWCILSAALAQPSSLFADDLVFFGNLHSHTSYSDGSGTPDQAYTRARDVAKLDFLAITEHNHRAAEDGAAADRHDGLLIGKNPALYVGPNETALIPTANRFNNDGHFIAIYGQEFSSISKGNHANVFDIGEVIDDHVVTNGRFDSLLEWLATHLDSTGKKAVLQFNHAALLDNYSIQYGADDFGTQTNWIAKMSDHAALFEMLNGPAMAKTSGNRAEELMEDDFKRYLLLGFHLAPTGDQDNHYFTWGTSTDVRTAIVTDQLTRSKLIEAMRARHVYATEDKNLRLVFKVNGHLCGDILAPPAPGAELQITYTIEDDDEPNAAYAIQVWSGKIGGSTASLLDSVSTTGTTSTPLTISDIHANAGEFVYFKIIQSNEDGLPDRAWTAPVWFDSATPVPGPEDVSQFVASRNSLVYHVSPTCRSAMSIKPSNRITGLAAKERRTQHQGCPVL